MQFSEFLINPVLQELGDRERNCAAPESVDHAFIVSLFMDHV